MINPDQERRETPRNVGSSGRWIISAQVVVC
jgi:hypothetical protein